MQELKFLFAKYCKSDLVQYRGDKKYAKRYLKQGYFITHQINDLIVLYRKAYVEVTLKNAKNKIGKFKILPQEIVRYYGKKHMNNKIFDRFCLDAKKGKIRFFCEDLKVFMK